MSCWVCWNVLFSPSSAGKNPSVVFFIQTWLFYKLIQTCGDVRELLLQSLHRVLNSWKKSWKLICPAVFQTWTNSGKWRKILDTGGKSWVFFQSYKKYFIREINVSFWSNLIQSCLYVCSTSWERLSPCIFPVITDLITLSLEKKIR